MVQGHVVAQPDEPPLLVPLQEVEGHNGNTEDDLMMPIEEVIQNNQVQPPTPPLNDEEVLAMDDNTNRFKYPSSSSAANSFGGNYLIPRFQ